MKFSVIVVSSGIAARDMRCMAALAAQSFKEFEVLVVGDGTPLPDDRFRRVAADKNAGPAALKNLAAQQAQIGWLFFVNPNVYLEPECLAVLNSATLRHEKTVIFGCTLLDDAVPAIIDSAGMNYLFAGFSWNGGQGWEVETLPDEGIVWGANGAAMLIKRDIFARSDGFDESFFAHDDDVDLNFRLRLMGHEPVQIVEAFARHEATHTVAEAFYATRNGLWTFVKNMPEILFWALLPLHLVMHFLSLLDLPFCKSRWDGLAAAYDGLPGIWKKRQQIQKNRTATLVQLACGFTWNPWKTIWRRADVRSVKADY